MLASRLLPLATLCPSVLFLISAICLPLISFYSLFSVWNSTPVENENALMKICSGLFVVYQSQSWYRYSSHVSPPNPDPSSKAMFPISASTPSKSAVLANRFTFRFCASSCALPSLPLVHSIVAMIDLIPQMRILPGHPQKPSSSE